MLLHAFREGSYCEERRGTTRDGREPAQERERNTVRVSEMSSFRQSQRAVTAESEKQVSCLACENTETLTADHGLWTAAGCVY